MYNYQFLNQFLNQYFIPDITNIILDYSDESKTKFKEVLGQISEYGFGIKHLSVLKFARMRDFGLPHMLHRTHNAFYKLLKNPDYEIILQDPNGFQDDIMFNNETWCDIIDNLLIDIGDDEDINTSYVI